MPEISASLQLLREPRESHHDAYLSESHGFLPPKPPKDVPESHRPWREVARRLPAIFRGDRCFRDAMAAMPLLSADEAVLPEADLLCCANMLGSMAVATYFLDRDMPRTPLPDNLNLPWCKVNERLNREPELKRPVFNYVDMFLHNWEFSAGSPATELDPFDSAQLVTADHRSPPPQINIHRDVIVRTPVFGLQGEAVFCKAMVDIHFVTRGLPAVIAHAQTAVVQRDDAMLERCLVALRDTITEMTAAFLRINPNPFSETYVDPVEWGRTVGFVGAPVHPGTAGPSGLTAPAVVLLDIFLKRSRWDSVFGADMQGILKNQLPQLWDSFIQTVQADEDVRQYIEENAARPDAGSAARTLLALWNQVVEAYAGSDGFLGQHRLKVYAFLEMAMKGTNETWHTHTHTGTHTTTHMHTHTHTHMHTHSLTHSPTHSLTHPLTHPPTCTHRTAPHHTAPHCTPVCSPARRRRLGHHLFLSCVCTRAHHNHVC
jgi:sulfite reductase (NADPH) flavoprotein alpha-component